MTPKQWMFDPNSGGIKIPPAVQADLQKRILTIAEKEFKGKYTRLEIRFKNQFCYIDSYTEPVLTDGWPPADWDETREEYAERLRNTPTHLCACAILAMTNGVLRSIRTATTSTNYPCTMMVSSLANQNARF